MTVRGQGGRPDITMCRRVGGDLRALVPQRGHAVDPQHRHAPARGLLLGRGVRHFALGTALGDFTATVLGLGYLASAIMFFFIILIPAVAWWRFGLNSVVAFWFAYVVTRPLGASFADYFGRARSLSGVGFGSGRVAVIVTIATAILVGYFAVTRCDVQPPRVRPAEPGTDREIAPGQARALGNNRPRVQAFWACASSRCRSHGQQPQRVLHNATLV